MNISCWECCCAPSTATVEDLATKAAFKTGDVLLFRANKTGRVAGINSLSASPWDHSGLVYVHDGEVVPALPCAVLTLADRCMSSTQGVTATMNAANDPYFG